MDIAKAVLLIILLARYAVSNAIKAEIHANLGTLRKEKTGLKEGTNGEA